MPKRSSKRLAGCIVIELAAVAGLSAANFEYRAGTARAGAALALALEDRARQVAVIAQADFAVTRVLSDVVAARLMKAYGLERAAILLRGSNGAPPPTPERQQDLTTAISAALGQLNPARILYNGAAIAVRTPEGRCLAAFASAGLSLDGCGAGDSVGGPIRWAFQMVEPAQGLQQREALPAAGHPIGAIALGDRVAILALGGRAPFDISAKSVIVSTFSNDNAPPPDDPQVRAAIASVLERVRRR
jgi:hypothetical protein